MIDVLLVDDDPAILQIAQAYLESDGDMLAKTAVSAIEAIKLMGYWSYDAIISDYSMPGGSGVDLLKALRRRGNEIPFILFTAKDLLEIEEDAFSQSWCRFMEKGANLNQRLSELKRMVRDMVRRKNLEDPRRSMPSSVDALMDTYCHDDQIDLEAFGDPIPNWMKARRPIDDDVCDRHGITRLQAPAMVAVPERLFQQTGMTLARHHHIPKEESTCLPNSKAGNRPCGGVKVLTSNEGLREADDLIKIKNELRCDRI
jgi:CheY-like chemotaxis protein